MPHISQGHTIFHALYCLFKIRYSIYMIDQMIKEQKKGFDTAFQRAHADISSIRTGRASPDLVSDLQVEYLGTPLKLKEIAAISTPDARTIYIQPWDQQAITGIEKAIRESSLGLSPVNEGVMIRITIPPLTEERRLEYTKIIGQKVEEARIRIRHLREDMLKKVQQAVKEKTAREDDLHRAKDQLQKIIDEYNGKLHEMQTKKEQELMGK